MPKISPADLGGEPSLIVDLFAGPGGWSEGLRSIGLSDVGIEWDAAACTTRAAAGHRTIRADVAQYPIKPFAGKVSGLIASPPCQDFSLAGKRAGRTGERGQLIDEVPRWVCALRPEWVACEQVPPAIEVWQEFADLFRSWGYSAWCGILNAADFGVPQTRRRAFLLASRVGPALPPEPTHDQSPEPSLFGPELSPWVSMAEALGWGYDHRPSVTLLAGGASTGGAEPYGPRERERLHGYVVDRRTNSKDGKGGMVPTVPVPMTRPSPTLTGKAGGQWTFHQPATTVAGDPRITARCHHDEGSQGANAKTTEQVRAGDYEGTEPIKLTVREALILQSFPPDYPVQGNKGKQFEQVGNAVPPALASAVVASLTRN